MTDGSRLPSSDDLIEQAKRGLDSRPAESPPRPDTSRSRPSVPRPVRRRSDRPDRVGPEPPTPPTEATQRRALIAVAILLSLLIFGIVAALSLAELQ